MLRPARAGVSYGKSTPCQEAALEMKKLFVVLAIVVVAVACGGQAMQQTSEGGALKAPNPQQSSSDGTRGGTTAPGTVEGPSTVPNTVPSLQGPPVIRQARVSITVKSGSFGSKLSEVRSEEHTSELQSLRHLVCRLL